MLFKDCINTLLNRFPTVDKISDNERTIAKIIFNLAMLEVYRAAFWYFRKKTGQMVLVPNYATGTCNVTNWDGTTTGSLAARTVQFIAPAVVSSNWVGRYFQPSGSKGIWYKIINVDTANNICYLDVECVDPTGAGITFIVWKRFYYAKGEADAITDVGNWDTNLALDFKTSTDYTDSASVLSSTGQPSVYSPYGSDPFDDKFYSVGSISGIINSQTIIGTGTNWLQNAESGDRLIVAGVEYAIKRVELDGQIILYQFITPAIAAGTAYSIRKYKPIGLEFYLNTDKYRVVHYEYMDRGYFLINEDNDLFLMPDEWFITVADRAEMMIKKDKKDPTWASTLQVYEAELAGLKQKKYVIEPKFTQFSPKIYKMMPGRKGDRQ